MQEDMRVALYARVSTLHGQHPRCSYRLSHDFRLFPFVNLATIVARGLWAGLQCIPI